MSDYERFADVFNYFLYEGKQVIESEKLHELDPTMIRLPYGDEGISDSIQKYRDVLKYLSAMYDDHAAYLLLGIENQSNVHYAMPVRNMLYDAGQYAKQVETAAASHRKKIQNEPKNERKKVSGDEFLSGFYKTDQLLPVITLVIYWAPGKWDGPRSLHEMFLVKDEKILAFVPDYRINLITPGSIADEDFGKFKTTLAEAFQYIKYSKDKIALHQIVHDNPKFRAMDRRTVELINGITGSGIEYNKDEEVVDVCLAIELMKQEAAEKAAEKAAAEATLKAREETRKEDMITSIRNLMDSMKWTADQAMAALKIPEEERERYFMQL
jgi:hypothetical protein